MGSSQTASRRPAVLKEGVVSRLCLPATLYHGTSLQCLPSILTEGLRIDISRKQSRLSGNAVYLLTDETMAAHFARSRAFRLCDEPVVLAIDTAQLNADCLAFDLNMCGCRWTEAMAYQANVPPSAIRQLSMDTLSAEPRLMLLGEPEPDGKPVIFDLDWDRAPEFLAMVSIG